MPLQRRLLFSMLALLALAAMAGVSSVFVGNSDFVWRVAGTLFTGAACLGAAIPFSRKLERQESRPTGVVGLFVSIGAFGVILLPIWVDFLFNRLGEQLALTAVAYCSVAIPFVGYFAASRRPIARFCGFAGMAACVIVFLFWLVAIWNRGALSGTLADKIGATAGLVAVASLPLTASLVGEPGSRRFLWRWLGAGASIIGTGMGLAGIWYIQSDNPTWLVIVLVFATGVGACNLLLRITLPGAQVWLVRLTAGVFALTCLCACLESLATGGFNHASCDNLLARLITAGVIVSVCGMLAIAVLKGFSRRMLVTSSGYVSEIRQVTVFCPRCARKFDASIGESRCTGCGLILLIRVAEPRCSHCDYTLLDIQAKVCPECGQPIGEASTGVVPPALL